MKNKIKKLIKKSNNLYCIFNFIYENLKKTYEGFFSLFFGFLPIDDQKIVFINYYGRGYGDNGKYIANELLSCGCNLDIVWLVNHEEINRVSIPSGIRIVAYGGVDAIYELSTAKIWINNCRLEQFLFKRKEQFYIQTWHGGLGLKKIERDAEKSLGLNYINKAKRDSLLSDFLISNSKHLSDIYRRAFWYDGEIVESGYPKNDPLFGDKSIYRKKIRTIYEVEMEKKIFLYAPTFRNGDCVSAYNLNFSKIKNEIKNKDQWIFMARLHPNIDEKIFYKIFPEFVINATMYSDMQELILGVDALVTDYSSCMFDSAIAEIPTFIYASDIDNYKEDRNFYFELEELPFPVSSEIDNFINKFNSFDEISFILGLKNFNKKVGLIDDGESSKRVFKLIQNLLN